MPESLTTIKDQESAESADLLPYFPTDLERARNGYEKFKEVFEHSGVLKKVAKKDRFFKLKILFSAAGLMPETGYFWGGGFEELDTEEERSELKRVYEEGLGLKTLHWQRFNEKEKWDHSVFNPASVEKVIKNCSVSDLFPEEAEKNPKEWADLDDSKNKARFGILSGYPPYASSVYDEYQKGIEFFIDKELTEKERKAYYKYANSSRASREFTKNLEKRFSEAIKTKELSESRAQLLKNWFSYKGNLEFFGDGFSDNDEKYFNNIKKIFDELGIDYKT